MNTPQPQADAEFDEAVAPALTMLCSKARLAYKSDEPFKNQALAKGEALAALRAAADKLVEARLEQFKRKAYEQGVNHERQRIRDEIEARALERGGTIEHVYGVSIQEALK